MGATTDFEKLRKRRRRIRLIQRISALAGIVLLFAGILSLNDILVSGGTLARLRDFVGGLGGGGYPIAAPGGTLREVGALGGDVAVLNDTNLYIYNDKGKEMLSLQRMSENTVMLAAGGRVLTYDIGGNSFLLHTRQTRLLEGSHDQPLEAMALSESGGYALASPSNQYAAQVTVFNGRFEQSFQWLSNELVSALALHAAGDTMAAACLGATGGVLESAVCLFSLDYDRELARVAFPDELILELNYMGDALGVLTDRGYHVLGAAGERLASHSFAGEQLLLARFTGGYAVFLCENPEARTQRLLLFDAAGQLLATFSPDSRVRDIALGESVYLLTDSEIRRLDPQLQSEGSLPAGGASRILLAGDKLYAFTAEEIRQYDIDELRGATAGRDSQAESYTP